MNSFTTFYPESAKVKKVWDTDELIDPQTSFVLVIETEYQTSTHIHARREHLENIYKALDDFFNEIHKAERAEKEAELYAEAMFDRMLDEAEALNARADMERGK